MFGKSKYRNISTNNTIFETNINAITEAANQ
jgi:hypothetical protein